MTMFYSVRTQLQYSFTFHPHHTALLIIDMQNDFCHPQGWYPTSWNTQLCRKPIRGITRMLSFARQQGLTVIFTREGHSIDLSDLSESKRSRYMSFGKTIGDMGPLGPILIRGAYGHDIIHELTPLADEIVVDKTGHGAFYNTRLDSILNEFRITHLLITGVTTECCVHSTMREANDRGYWCLLLEDCCSAFTESDHQNAVEIIKQGTALGWIATAQDILPASSDS